MTAWLSCRRVHPSAAHNSGDSAGAAGPGARRGASAARTRPTATLMKVPGTSAVDVVVGSGAIDGGVGIVANVVASGWLSHSAAWPAVAVAAKSRAGAVSLDGCRCPLPAAIWNDSAAESAAAVRGTCVASEPFLRGAAVGVEVAGGAVFCISGGACGLISAAACAVGSAVSVGCGTSDGTAVTAWLGSAGLLSPVAGAGLAVPAVCAPPELRATTPAAGVITVSDDVDAPGCLVAPPDS